MPNMPEVKKAWRMIGSPQECRSRTKAEHNRKVRRKARQALQAGKEPEPYRGINAWDVS